MENEKIETIFAGIKEKGVQCEYDFLLYLYAILKSEGFPVLLTELNAMSGYSLRFLYDYKIPFVFNGSIDYIKSNIKIFLGVDIIVDRLRAAADLPKEPFILYPQNLLIAKVEKGRALFYRSVFCEEKDIEELLAKNSFVVTVDYAKIPDRKGFYGRENFLRFVNLMKKEFLNLETEIMRNNVSSGKMAYKEFAGNLRNQEFSFSMEDGTVHPYLSSAVYPQWTALNGNVSYLLGIHHFLNEKAQKEMIRAVKHFEDVLLFWRQWERNVGRKAFIPPTKTIPLKNRRRAANALDKASDAYARGLESLQHVKSIIDA